ncbi:MAG: hypothetical protein AAB595_00010 [Patescibacteria group bacterium]
MKEPTPKIDTNNELSLLLALQKDLLNKLEEQAKEINSNSDKDTKNG